MALPSNLVPTRRTKTFSETSVPKGLLREHATRAGVWGRIEVESGAVIYRVTEPGCESETRLTAGAFGLIEPEAKHHLRIEGPVTFFVQFYERPASPSDD